MVHEVLLLLGGLVLIIKGGDIFVAAAVRVAAFLRMPRVVIGSTLVSLATTTPELAVAVMAGMKGESGLAVGNAVGSVICNIGLILGVTATIKHVDVHPPLLRWPLITMFGAGVILFLMTLDLDVGRWQGSVLMAVGAGYFIWDFWKHWQDRKPHDVSEATAIEEGVTASRLAWLKTPEGSIAQFLAGAGVVVLGSRLLVDGAVGIASQLGIPSIVIGLSIVAVGTSLPELITAIASSRKSVSDLAVGNVLGANIANLTLVVGAAALIHDVAMDRQTQVFNFPAMLVMMSLFLVMLLTDRRVTRREGAALLLAYGAYLGILIALTITGRT